MPPSTKTKAAAKSREADEQSVTVPTAGATPGRKTKPKAAPGTTSTAKAAPARRSRKPNKQSPAQRSTAVSASARQPHASTRAEGSAPQPSQSRSSSPGGSRPRRSGSAGSTATARRPKRHADPHKTLKQLDTDPVFEQLRAGPSSASSFRPYTHTITAVSAALERALGEHCLQRLLALPVADVERMVYRVMPQGNHKAVMTHLKAQAQAARHRAAAGQPAPAASAASASATTHSPAASPLGSGAAPAARWCKSPKVAPPPHEVSIMSEAHRAAVTGSRSRSGTPAGGGRRRDLAGARGEASVARFNQAFLDEVRMAFIDVCGEACLARRERFYREQPQMVRDRNVVIPEKVLQPFYTQAVTQILYRTLGWTESEAKAPARAVASSIRAHMPPVAHAVQPPEAAAADAPFDDRHDRPFDDKDEDEDDHLDSEFDGM